MEGMSEFAEEILGMPVRIGFPTGVKGITQAVQGPQFSTGVGLVKYGAQAITEAAVRASVPRESVMRMQARPGPAEVEEAVRKDGSKIWEWLKAAF
jgi:cell division protein FtsA